MIRFDRTEFELRTSIALKSIESNGLFELEASSNSVEPNQKNDKKDNKFDCVRPNFLIESN